MDIAPLVLALTFALAIPQGSGRAAAVPSPDARLTVADVARVTGLDVHQIAAGSRAGAGFNLNFADATGLVLGVNFGTVALYDRAKAQKTMNIMGKDTPMPLFSAAVAGIGDEAFDSPPGKLQWVIYAKKGRQAFAVSTFLAHGTTPRVPMPQMIDIAKLIASRL
jgi:hypothetical protein